MSAKPDKGGAEEAEPHDLHLSRLQQEVEILRGQLRHAQRLAAVGTMAAMVAHEFNNILTPIVNYAQLAQTNPNLTEKALARAADGGQRATNICKAILGIARPVSASPESVNLAELISETLFALARDPHRDGIEVQFRAPGELAVVAYRSELQQVLLNLLLNARAAVLAKNGPRQIEIEAGRHQSEIFLRVSDNGVGIPPENLEKIFLPFFTTKTAPDPQSRGNGLGLAISQEIVQSMGGRITVESTEGEETTFTVSLPAKSRVAPAVASASQAG